MMKFFSVGSVRAKKASTGYFAPVGINFKMGGLFHFDYLIPEEQVIYSWCQESTGLYQRWITAHKCIQHVIDGVEWGLDVGKFSTNMSGEDILGKLELRLIASYFNQYIKSERK